MNFFGSLGFEHGQGLFEHLPDHQFWMKDRLGRYLYVNSAFLNNYNLARIEDVLGRTDHDLSPRHLADRFVEDDRRVLEKGGSIINHVELVGRFDGTIAWFATSKLPLKNREGLIVGTTGMTRELKGRHVSESLYGDLGTVIVYMRDHLADPIRDEDLARLANLSISAFQRRFRRFFKMTPNHYLKQLRVAHCREALLGSRRTLAAIAADCGLCDHSYLSKEFKRFVGLSPGQYREKYRN